MKPKLWQMIYYQLIKRHYFGITSQSRVLPDFLIIGAKRCGTTSLFTNLPKHPSIINSHHDNMGFFNDNFHLGVNWYKSFFPTQAFMEKSKKKYGTSLSFDTTTTYMEHSSTAENVKKTKPDMKIIIMLRNPIDRAYSQYNRTIKIDGIKSRNFEDVVMTEIEKLSDHKNTSFQILRDESNYIKKGLYYEQLKPWFELFPRKNIGIFSTEDFKNDSQKTYDKIFDFLELTEFIINDNEIMEKGNYSPMDKKTRNFLSNFYKSHNEKLFQLIEQKFEWDD
jgi:hypothetical protein